MSSSAPASCRPYARFLHHHVELGWTVYSFKGFLEQPAIRRDVFEPLTTPTYPQQRA